MTADPAAVEFLDSEHADFIDEDRDRRWLETFSRRMLSLLWLLVAIAAVLAAFATAVSLTVRVPPAGQWTVSYDGWGNVSTQNTSPVQLSNLLHGPRYGLLLGACAAGALIAAVCCWEFRWQRAMTYGAAIGTASGLLLLGVAASEYIATSAASIDIGEAGIRHVGASCWLGLAGGFVAAVAHVETDVQVGRPGGASSIRPSLPGRTYRATLTAALQLPDEQFACANDSERADAATGVARSEQCVIEPP